MNEQVLRGLVEDVRHGKLSRRAFTRAMIGVGLTAPIASQMLAYSGVAVAAEQFVYKPTRRGGGGALKLLWWQAPTLLNPHFAVGGKDYAASRIFYEPLAGWDADGNLKPVLATEVPMLDNGGLGEDGRSVTWKLKQGVKWHDGEPFTADDCVFTWEYAKDSATAAATIGAYKDANVVKVDDHTVRVEFAQPRPFWARSFVGPLGMVLPQYDFAFDMAVEDEILKRLETGGKGRIVITPNGSVEYIQLNNTDPWKEVDGERSSIETRHPFLTDPAVRQALNLLVDRASVHQFIYGRTGYDTANFLNAPEKFVSKNTNYEFNIEQAIKLLDDAGWKTGPDGIREKSGVRLKAVFQTTINATRQKTQAIVKQACQKAGIEIEIKAVTPSVFLSSDAGNPDTYRHFYADLQMMAWDIQVDPGFSINQFLSSEVASKENKWTGRNVTRWQSPEYDKLYAQSEVEIDPVKRAAMLIALNDMLIKNVVVIPVVTRPIVTAVANNLHPRLSGWDSGTFAIEDWYRDT